MGAKSTLSVVTEDARRVFTEVVGLQQPDTFFALLGDENFENFLDAVLDDSLRNVRFVSREYMDEKSNDSFAMQFGNYDVHGAELKSLIEDFVKAKGLIKLRSTLSPYFQNALLADDSVSSIRRWDVGSMDARTSSDGKWVLYDDHVAAMKSRHIK